MVAALVIVSRLGEVADVDEIAIQGTSGGAQAVVRVHIVFVGIGILHLAMITERSHHGVGALESRSGILSLKTLEARAYSQRERLRQYEVSAGSKSCRVR